MDHYIKLYKQILDLEICNKIIEKFEEDDRKSSGLTSIGYDPDVKSCIDLHTDTFSWKELDLEIYRAIRKTFNKYKEDCPSIEYITKNANNNIVDTGYQIQKYNNNNKDQFDWHIDSGDVHSINRILAGIVYLNNVDCGGETEFELPSGIMKIKPEAGSILWFPPFFQYPHRGTMPISSPKYVITTFIVYKIS